MWVCREGLGLPRGVNQFACFFSLKSLNHLDQHFWVNRWKIMFAADYFVRQTAVIRQNKMTRALFIDERGHPPLSPTSFFIGWGGEGRDFECNSYAGCSLSVCFLRAVKIFRSTLFGNCCPVETSSQKYTYHPHFCWRLSVNKPRISNWHPDRYRADQSGPLSLI